MTRVIHNSLDTRLERLTADGESLWMDRNDMELATGWLWKPEGLCRGEICIALPRTDLPLVDGDRLDVARVWRNLGWPIVHDQSGDLWVLGESASQRAAALTSLDAPDFELPDLDGRRHRLSDYRGRQVLLVTWASWCGCRTHLSDYQLIYEVGKDHGFTVLAIALDQPDAARPWIEAAAPGYPCLIDRDHQVAELYNLVNVPQTIWIDEAGRMVRPPETGGTTDGWRTMDRQTFTMSQKAVEEGERVKTAYFDAVRDWAIQGAKSRYVLDAETVMARLAVPDAAIAKAHAHFRLGQALLRDGQSMPAKAEFTEATRLHPDSWAMWRQTADKHVSGLAVGEDFWQRVDALGERHYYAPVDLDQPASQKAVARKGSR